MDAVHPTHGARAAGCWAAKDEHLAIEQTTGRQRLNIHGAIDLETGRTKMIEAEAIDAASTIKLLPGIEALYSTTALIHVFLDNARYHHAKIVRKWLSQPGRRIALHFVPSYCPHAAAECDHGKVCVVTTHALAFIERFPRGHRRARMFIAERDVPMHEIADRLDARHSGRRFFKEPPRRFRQTVSLAGRPRSLAANPLQRVG